MIETVYNWLTSSFSDFCHWFIVYATVQFLYVTGLLYRPMANRQDIYSRFVYFFIPNAFIMCTS